MFFSINYALAVLNYALAVLEIGIQKNLIQDS